jgi:tripartite-type tricarboxylate transporter receptor subunit TctC
MVPPRLLRAVCAACLSAAAALAAAQDYPSRMVKMIVPSSPAAGLDLFSRALAQQLSAKWGQQIVIVNRPGGSGTIGVVEGAQSPPDGYTLLMATDQTMSIVPHLFQKVPYKPSDFIPVTQVLATSFVLVAHPSFPPNSIAELVQHAKHNPGKVNYASNGIGSTAHLAGELFKADAGIDLTMVPYKGIAPAQQAVLANEVELAFVGTATAPYHLNQGKLKALAIAGPSRSPTLPNVPTFAEAGYPGVESTIWFGIFLPAGTPAGIVAKLHKDIVAVINDPVFREKELLQKGFQPVGSSPGEFADFLKYDFALRGRAVKLSGAKPE